MNDNDPWTHITPLFLHEEVIKQFGKLVGVETVPSPTSVLAPLQDNDEHIDEDEFQSKVNGLATHFINESERILLIHLQHCDSMNICNTDLRYAIEQFTKAYLRHPAPYIQLGETDHEEHIDENYDSDEEWVTSDPDEYGNDSDVEMDHILDDEFEAVDELDADARMECEENEEAWIVKPTNYPTLLFDAAYPVLTESEEFFKLSDQDFLLLVTEVMHNRFQCDYHFDEQCVKIFKVAMIRYILAECRKD